MKKLFLLTVALFTLIAQQSKAQQPAAMSSDLANIVYIGIDNPMSLAVAGTQESLITAETTNGTLTGSGCHYIWNPNQPGKGEIIVKNKTTGFEVARFLFRVRRIPDPQLHINGISQGKISKNVFKTSKGLSLEMENFAYDIFCNVVSYNILRIPKYKDPVPVTNDGANYSQDATNLIKQAVPGDIFVFEDVKIKCPGDAAARYIGTFTYIVE